MKIIASNLLRTSLSNPGNRPGSNVYKTEMAKDDRDAKRLRDLQAGLRQLGAGQTPKQMAKQAAAEKIGMLQRRLMQLKQMLMYATPEQAKALARELKSIAGELASAAKAAGASQGAFASVAGMAAPDIASDPSGGAKADSATAAQGADTQADESVADEAKQAAAAAASPSNAATAGQTGKTPQEDGSLSGNNRSARPADSAEIPDTALKDMLKEARKLLKEVIDLVKRKMGQGDPESRKDLAEAESKLQDIALNTETRVDSASLYTSQGVGTADIGGATAGGINISVEA